MKNLVIVNAGDQSLHRFWLSEPRNFDLFVIYYGNRDAPFLHDGIFHETSPGLKFDQLGHAAHKWAKIVARYDAIFIPDDDIYLTGEQITEFFDIFHRYRLRLAQPSLIGHIERSITAHQPGNLLRYVNYVDHRCMCFDNVAWQICVHHVRHNKIGCNFGLLFPHLLGTPKDQVAIIDDIIAVHTRAIGSGDLYRLAEVDAGLHDYFRRKIPFDFSIKDEETIFSTVPSNKILSENQILMQAMNACATIDQKNCEWVRSGSNT